MSPPRTKRPPRWWSKITRDVILCTAGVALTVNESLRGGAERPSLYVLYAGMMGLGPILRFAESRSKEPDE